MQRFDYIIVGQGIAGSTLAWQLRWLNQRVAIVDRNEPNTASKISSGLISPITGKRNARSWRFDQLEPIARQFYEHVEAETNERFVRFRPMLKVVSKEFEKQTSTQPHLGDRKRLPKPFDHSIEAIEVAPAGQLDAPSFLRATKSTFVNDAAYFVGDIDSQHDLELSAPGVVLDRFQISAKALIFCQGIAGNENNWWDDLEFQPTKGEILTIELDTEDDLPVVQHNVWLAPTNNHRFLAGATYDRDFESVQPTDEGRNEVIEKLTEFAPKDSFRVVDHHAALRPVLKGRLPKVGLHSRYHQLGFFNGLGSKGSLRAPFVAQQLARHLVYNEPLDEEIRFSLVGKTQLSNRRLTDIAHDRVASVVRSGDIAIDTTAGNGLDTVFLSKIVGEKGQVVSIDVQQEALDRTASRLPDDVRQRVSLQLGSHENMLAIVPKQHHGNVAAVMFNLGYLPRGNKNITTTTESTIAAIEQSIVLLRPGGVITIVAYTGHDGGLEETRAIESYLGRFSMNEIEIDRPPSPLVAGPPRMYWLRKPL